MKILLVVVWVLFSVPALAQFGAENPKSACARDHEKDTARVRRFIFKTYLSNDGACLQVSDGSRVIFRRTLDSPQGFTVGQAANKEWKVPAIANGTDLTGRGHPDMIVSFYTGGAHCCTFHLVFELEPQFKLLATVDDADTDFAHFANLGDEPNFYLLTGDWSFAYWPASFASSPSHSIVLRYVDDDRGGGYHLALDKMQRPAPTPEQWKKALRDVNEVLEESGLQRDGIGATLWNTVLDLIYAGHSDLAWKFVDEAGPKAQQGDNPKLAEFCSVLKTSRYWPDLEETIRNAPTECANAKAEWPR